jgi:ABC-type sulfate transport system permease subunit
MFHPIFSVLIKKPDLVIDHVSGYAGLIREEASAVGAETLKCVVYGVAAAVCGVVFLILAGVAAMLGAMHQQFHWALVFVPGVVLAAAVVAGLMAKSSIPNAAFTELRSQIDADAEMLRALGAQS